MKSLPWYTHLVLLLSVVSLSTQQTTVSSSCERTMDLVFIIDGSNSLGPINFDLVRETVAKAVDVLRFGSNLVRVGAVLYSTEVNAIVALTEDKLAFQKAVRNFDYPDEGTFTNLAIDEAVKLLSTPRPGVPRTMLIVTDGSSSNQPLTEISARSAASQGIDIWGVGVSAKADMEELGRITTNGTRQTFAIGTFDLVPDQLINLTRTVCNDSSVLSTFTIPTTTPTTTSTTTRTTPTTTTTTTTTIPTTRTTSTPSPTTSTTTTTPTTSTSTTSTTRPTTTTTTTTTTTPTTTTTRPTTTTTTPTTTTPTTTTTTRPTTTTPTTTTTASTTTRTTSTTTTPPTTTTTPPTTTTSTSSITSTSTPLTSRASTASTSQSLNPTPLILNPSNNYSGNLADLCVNSLSVAGVGYVLYPGDCSKVIQCYFNQLTNKTLVVTRQCPLGQFWDQTCLKCLPSAQVDCPYDKCRKGPCSQESCLTSAAMNETYAMEGVCGGFWSCYNGRSSAKCCPPLYSYLPGYGCQFSTSCLDQCDLQAEECLEGIGVCEKVPDWKNRTQYGIASDSSGLLMSGCSQSDLNLVDCSCQLRLLDIFMTNLTKCSPYHEVTNLPIDSSYTSNVPIRQLTSFGTWALQIRVEVSSPNFEVSSRALVEDCQYWSHIRVWADSNGIHASLGDVGKVGALVTVLHKNATGVLDLTVTSHRGKLTLGVRQGNVQYVATVRASNTKSLCPNCMHGVTLTSNVQERSINNQIRLFNCHQDVTDIYIVG